MLKDNGYATALFGKWHCGYQDQYNPVHHGFDEFIGFLNGATDYHRHGNWRVGLEKTDVPGYSTHVITDRSVDFIKQNKDKPFFYSSRTLPCTTLTKRRRHAGQAARGGRESQRAERQNETAPSTSWMLEDLDTSVGRIVDTLNEHDLVENTLVMFFSDNGAVGMSPKEFRMFRGGKFSHYEGGHRVPAVAWWPGQIEAGVQSDELIVGFDLFPTLTDIAGSLKRHPVQPRRSEFQIPPARATGIPGQGHFFGYEPKLGTAMRRGDWKMIVKETTCSSSIFRPIPKKPPMWRISIQKSRIR